MRCCHDIEESHITHLNLNTNHWKFKIQIFQNENIKTI